MAEIIQLEQRRGHDPAPPKAGVPVEAKILFFTGVRYERLDDTPDAKRPVAKKGRSTRAGKR